MPSLPFLARAASVLLLAAGAPALADYWSDYANAALAEALRREGRESFWRDMVVRPSRHADTRVTGPRSWEATNESPWANTYGTPPRSDWRSTTLRPRGPSVVRMCSCYLSADARSWDGGPLTEADIARMCRAQCY